MKIQLKYERKNIILFSNEKCMNDKKNMLAKKDI
jgi:hypothetical protein